MILNVGNSNLKNDIFYGKISKGERVDGIALHKISDEYEIRG